MTRPLQPCGTRGAYQRHLYHREVPCRPCTDAQARDSADRAARPWPQQAPWLDDLWELIDVLNQALTGDQAAREVS